jgi:hypothetical protein
MTRLFALALLALATPALAAEVDLIKGGLSATSQTASQVIAVKNNTIATIASAKVECGFYSGEVLSGSGFAYLHDLSLGKLPGARCWVSLHTKLGLTEQIAELAR